jgi:uncharacterized membrane protein YhfC
MEAPRSALLWLLAGLVVLAGSLVVCIALKRRRPTSWADVALGGSAWSVAVGLKILCAVAVFGALRRHFGEAPPWYVSIPTTGLLTGVFECGTSLVVVGFSRLRRGGWDSALAFGASFGTTENVVLAAPMVLAAGMAIWGSGLMDAADAKALVEQMADSVRPLTFILERGAALAVHVYGGALIVAAVQWRRPSWFWLAFLLKSVIDALPAEGQLSKPVIESAYAVIGVASLLGLRRLVRDVAAVSQSSSLQE